MVVTDEYSWAYSSKLCQWFNNSVAWAVNPTFCSGVAKRSERTVAALSANSLLVQPDSSVLIQPSVLSIYGTSLKIVSLSFSSSRRFVIHSQISLDNVLCCWATWFLVLSKPANLTFWYICSPALLRMIWHNRSFTWDSLSNSFLSKRSSLSFAFVIQWRAFTGSMISLWSERDSIDGISKRLMRSIRPWPSFKRTFHLLTIFWFVRCIFS